MDLHINENFKMDIHGGGFDSDSEPASPADHFKVSCAKHRRGFDLDSEPARLKHHSTMSCRRIIHFAANPF